MAGPIAGFGGLNLPNTLTVALLSEGTSALTTVRGTPEAPFILVNNQRLLLDDAGLQPGDTVRVTRLAGEGVSRFDIAHEDTGPTPSSAAEALPQILARLSSIAGRTLPEALVPPGFPAGDAVRQLVALFQDTDAPGPTLDHLAGLLRAANVPDSPALRALSTLISQLGVLNTADPVQIAALLKSLVQKRAPEASLSNASPEELAMLAKGDLASVLAQLRNDPALRAALAQAGKLDEFLAAADAVLDRLDGARAQQLHGPQQGYVFLELPLPKESGFNHAAAHFYQEGHARPQDRNSLPSVAVLDLDLTHLGPLWITVRAFQGTCTTEFLAANPGTAAALTECAPEITQALREAGYSGVQVQTGAWDANRLDRSAALLARLRPLDVSI